MAAETVTDPNPAPAPAGDTGKGFVELMNDELRGTEPGVPPKPIEQPKPAEPPKPPSEEAADEEILSGKRSPKSEDFKRINTARNKIREQLATATTEVEKIKAELAKAQAAPKEDPAKIAELQEKATRFENLYNVIALEFTPEFSAKYEKRVEEVMGALKKSLPEDKAVIIDLLSMPDSPAKRKQLAEAMDDLDAFTGSEIALANQQLRQIASERSAELANSKTKLDEIVSSRQKAAQADAEASAKFFEAAVATKQDITKGNPALQIREGDDAWNKGVSERIELARHIYNGNFVSPNERADAAFWAASAPVFAEQAAILSKENAELKETIAKMQGANPNLGGGEGGDKAPEKSFYETMESELRPVKR